jgi:hypothetical protein
MGHDRLEAQPPRQLRQPIFVDSVQVAGVSHAGRNAGLSEADQQVTDAIAREAIPPSDGITLNEGFRAICGQGVDCVLRSAWIAPPSLEPRDPSEEIDGNHNRP